MKSISMQIAVSISMILVSQTIWANTEASQGPSELAKFHSIPLSKTGPASAAPTIDPSLFSSLFSLLQGVGGSSNSAGLKASAAPQVGSLREPSSLGVTSAMDESLARATAADLAGSDIPKIPLKQALLHRQRMLASGANVNPDKLVVVDLTAPSNAKRMWVIDLKSGVSKAYTTSHGGGRSSNQNDLTCASKFGNQDESYLSSTGAFTLGCTMYDGKGRRAVFMHGQERSNQNAANREIIFHEASYNSGLSAGRSQGCLTSSSGQFTEIVGELNLGSCKSRGRNQQAMVYVYPSKADIGNFGSSYWNASCKTRLAGRQSVKWVGL